MPPCSRSSKEIISIILGYSSQPKTSKLKKYVAPKGHYLIWSSHLDSRLGEDVWGKYGPAFCASQYNIDISLDDAIRYTNTVVALSPVLLSLSANSPVFDGRATEVLSNRFVTFQEIDKNKFFYQRAHFPSHYFKNLRDYILTAWRYPLFEIMRDGVSWYQKNNPITPLEFAKRGKARFQDLGGKSRVFDIEVSDLFIGLYFYWPAVRVKVMFREDLEVNDVVRLVKQGKIRDVLIHGGDNCYVEIRAVDTAPQSELMSWLAVFIGLLKNLDDVERLVKGWSAGEVKRFVSQLQRDGLRARWKGRKLSEWGDDVLRVAKQGLRNHDTRVIRELNILERRLEKKHSPADDALKVFREKGLEEMIRGVRFK